MQKLFNKILVLIIACVFILCSFGCNQNNNEKAEKDFDLELITENTEYTKSQSREAVPFATCTIMGIDKDVMPIGGFMEPVDAQLNDNGSFSLKIARQEVFDAIGECGVNLIYGHRINYVVGHPECDAGNMLKMAGNAGVQMIVLCEQLINAGRWAMSPVANEETVKAALTELKEFPAFSGIHGADEPSAAIFHGDNSITAANQRIRKVSEELDMNTAIYWNLTSSNAVTHSENGKYLFSGTSEPVSYDEFMDNYMSTNPDFVLYDNYPFRVGSDDAVWFRDLSVMKEKSEKNNKPFWAFNQTGGKFDNANFYRLPTEQEFMWNTNTILVYGAKGFAYFPLVTPPEWAIKTDVGANSLINPYGSKNIWWHYAKKINTHIQACDEYLMNAAHIGLIQHGETPLPIPEKDLLGDKWRELKSVTGDDALIGCFDYKGRTALYVVNNSFTKDNGNIALEFDNRYGYDVIQRGEKISVAGTGIPLTLNAGESALIVLK